MKKKPKDKKAMVVTKEGKEKPKAFPFKKKGKK